MSLIAVVLTLIAIGVLLWLAETYIPMSDPIKKLLRVVVIVAVVIWLLRVFGIWQYIDTIKI
jgi:hypothetical protein